MDFDIQEDMTVVGSDGEHVGTVDKVEGDQIKLTKADSPDGKHNFVPLDLIESAEDGTVTLSETAEDVIAQFDTNEAHDEAGSAVGGS